jgi:hypothetical protein
MWEPQPLTTLRASKACRGENFTLTASYVENISVIDTKFAVSQLYTDVNVKGKLGTSSVPCI